jgi:hypothetical protein
MARTGIRGDLAAFAPDYAALWRTQLAGHQ